MKKRFANLMIMLITSMALFMVYPHSNLTANDEKGDRSNIKPTDNQIDQWGKWLDDTSLYAREEAADHLGRSRNPKAIKYLLKALKDSEPTVRAHPARHLWKYDDPIILPALLDALKKENIFYVQYSLMRSIEKILKNKEEKDQYNSLINTRIIELKKFILESTDIRLKTEGALCLVRNFHEEPDQFENIFASILSTKDNETEKNSSIEILGKMGSMQSISAIHKALNDKNDIVRDNAKRILKKLEK